jgi:hypothetical protein
VELAATWAIGRNSGQREFCPECGKEHMRLDGVCWAKTTCSICSLPGHPSDRCFKLCKNGKCENAPLHHRDKCPHGSNPATAADILRERLRASEANIKKLAEYIKAKGLTDAPTLKE